MNPEMSRLKAYFHVLLNGDEASLPARRKAAQAILDDEDVGGEESKALSIPHRKSGSALAYLKGGTVKALPNAGRRAAKLYAILYTVGEEAGHGPPPHELLSACRELAPHGWSVEEREGGQFLAVPVKEMVEQYAKAGRADQYAHAPKGGISINGVWYVGGRFIPGTETDESVGVLPNGMQVKVGDIRRSQGEMKRAAPSRGRETPARIDTSPLDIMAKSLPGGRPNEAAAASLMKVVRSHEGHNAGERLIELGAYLKAVVASLRAKGMPQAKFRLLADAAATLALAGRMLSPPDDELNGIKLAFPKAGMLYLVPGIPADSEREFLAAGFVRVAPGRFGGPDSEETRDLAERNGFTFVLPAGRDDAP
jgi:hypothetical protein